MKKLIERIKDTFRRDKLPQDISNHLESTRNIYDFIREDKEGKLYIPIPKEESVKVLDDLSVNVSNKISYINGFKVGLSTDCKFYSGFQEISNEYTLLRNELKSNYNNFKEERSINEYDQ